MRCPVDNETLVMTERSGVEIDYCPKCRGVWLDRGELDKILERSAAAAAPAPVPPAPPAAAPRAEALRDDRPRDRDRDDDRDDDDRYRRDHPRKRRESFLSDLFDF